MQIIWQKKTKEGKKGGRRGEGREGKKFYMNFPKLLGLGGTDSTSVESNPWFCKVPNHMWEAGPGEGPEGNCHSEVKKSRRWQMRKGRSSREAGRARRVWCPGSLVKEVFQERGCDLVKVTRLGICSWIHILSLSRPVRTVVHWGYLAA